MDDHNSTYVASNEGDCTLYEHLTTNYKNCEANYPGFISPTDMDTPTETAVGNDRKYFTRLEYDPMGEGTGIKLDQCPQHTSILQDATGTDYVGGDSPIGSCFLRRQGECVDTTSQYCNSGGDFICPAGHQLTTGTQDNTYNDCLACTAGDYCADGSVTTCSDGYQCPAYSYDGNAYPAQPGDIISSNTESACT